MKVADQKAAGLASRRQFMRLASGQILGAGLVLLVACGPQAASGGKAPAAAPTQSGAAPAQSAATGRQGLTLNLMWDGWIIDQNPVVNDLAAAYGQETGVKIKPDKSPDDVDQKVLLEARQGKSTWGGREGHSNTSTAALVEGDALAAWDPFLTKDDLDDLFDTSKEEMKYKGKAYFFPMRVSPVLLGVWLRTVEKLGYKDIPTSWDEVVEIAGKASTSLSSGNAKFFGYGLLADPNYGLWAIMATYTTKPFDYDKGLANLDQPAAAEALRTMQQLFPFCPPEGLADLTPLTNTMMTGRMALVQVHVVRAGRAKVKFQDDFRIARLPRTKDAEGTNYWSSGATVFKHYGNADVQAEAAKFWLWYSKQKKLYDSLWLKNGSPPNRKSMQKLYEPLKGKELDAGYWDLFKQQEISQPRPSSLVLDIQLKYTQAEVSNLLLGKTKSPEAAIASIKKQTTDEIAKQQR